MIPQLELVQLEYDAEYPEKLQIKPLSHCCIVCCLNMTNQLCFLPLKYVMEIGNEIENNQTIAANFFCR